MRRSFVVRRREAAPDSIAQRLLSPSAFPPGDEALLVPVLCRSATESGQFGHFEEAEKSVRA